MQTLQEAQPSRKKLLFVTNTMGRAGAEKALVTLLGMVDRARYDISLLSLVPRGEMFAQVPEGITLLGEPPDARSVLSDEGHRFLMGRVLRACAHPAALLRTVARAPRDIAWQWRSRGQSAGFQLDKLAWELLADAAPRFDTTFDLAVAYLEGGATYYVARHVRARKKAAFIHIDYQLSGLNPRQDAPFYAKFDAIFGVSGDVLRSFLRAHPQCAPVARVFHNRVPHARIRELARAPGGFADGYDGLRLLTVARLHPQKAFDIAIRALRRALDAGYRVRWYVLGEGPERDKLLHLIAQHGLTEDFVLLGAVDNPYPYMRQCDIYLQATHYEGWSIALAEALILGRPAICSDCTGNREQIEDERTGLLISLDEVSLANAIARMAGDAALRARLTEALRGIDFDRDDEMQFLYRLADADPQTGERRDSHEGRTHHHAGL